MENLRGRDVVLLDAGGTLITLDYERVRRILGAAAAAAADEALDRAETAARGWAADAARRGVGVRAIWDGYFGRILLDVGVAEPAVPRLLGELWTANREQGLWCRPIDGAPAVLRQLRAAGLRLAVVSNAEGRVEQDLAEAGYSGLFETVVDSHLVGVAKPDPRIFRIALERLGARAGQAVYVGDVPAYDVEGARAAGIAPILVDPLGLHGELAGVHRIRSLQELPALLDVGHG